MITQRGSVLILLNDRAERRRLFELLDSMEFESIYTAKDTTQARAMLGQGSVALVVLELMPNDPDALAFCSEIQAQPGDAKLPVLAILAATTDQSWPHGEMPATVTDWVKMPIDIELARQKIERLFQPSRRKETYPVHTEATFRFAFDHALDEMLLSDPVSGLILEANTTFLSQSGFSVDDIIGSPLDDLDLSYRDEQRQALIRTVSRIGMIKYRCLTPRADGRRTLMDAVIKQVRIGTDIRWLTFFRPAAIIEDHGPALASLMDELWAAKGATSVAKAAAQKLVEFGKLDILLIVSAPIEHLESTPIALNYVRQGVPKSVFEQLSQVLAQRVQCGNEFVIPANAWKAFGNEPPAGGFRLELLIGISLRNSNNAVIGGLLAGSRDRLLESSTLSAAARAVAARIMLELDLERALDQGRAMGLQDSLTGLPNRLLFHDRLETTLREAHRTGEMFAVLFIDLDRFKTVNDSLGHAVGDELLVAISKRLRTAIRGSDTVARYAGDEFTLILRHLAQRDDVLRIAEKICRILELPLTLGDGRELNITASIGISFYPEDADNADKLLRHADIAMYNVKGMGRNNYQAYVAMPEESHQQRLALEAKLRLAERNGELRNYYQPQVASTTEDIIGMEALIRWEHPELGMISPGFFIPLAEETGLIMSIGEWVLRTALADTKRWHQRFGHPLRLSVNLSALQLRQPSLVDMVRSALISSEVDARYLELEVTESINVKTIPNLIETLQGLRNLGCSIAIDDFGTGQSSLDYIRRFPADRIKIDQIFVRNIGVDPDDEAIVRATISMGQSLNLGIIAEGVEYEEHLNFLRDNGCEELQGYLFSRPLPAAAFENLMLEREKAFTGGLVPNLKS